MNRTPDQESPSARMLLIYIEPMGHNGDYRHIKAVVLRRAMRDEAVPIGSEGATRMVYWDGKDAQGYRWADWDGNKKNSRFVCGMSIRGQIDMGPNPLAEGKPYGNHVEFEHHRVTAFEANAMALTFRHLEKRRDYFQDKGFVFNDDFADQCRLLCMSLGITQILTCSPSHPKGGTPDMSQTSAFMVDSIAQLNHVVDKVLARLRA